jgi:putative membrane protein
MTTHRRNDGPSTTLLALVCGVGLILLTTLGCASGNGGTTAAAGDKTGTVVVKTSPAGTEPPPAEGAPAEGAPATAPGTEMGTATQPAPGAQAAAFEDADVLGVLRTVNASEVKTGQLAATKATSPQVRQFAQQMTTEHSEANQQLAASPVPPRDNSLSQLIDQQVNAAIERLNGLSGPDFDQQYVHGQVQMHEQVLQLIDAQLLPAAQTAEVKQVVDGMRQAVAQHLQKAQQLEAELRLGR